MSSMMDVGDAYRWCYSDYNKISKWAYDELGLTILYNHSPNKHTYQGTNLLYAPDPDRLFHEIGHYVVCSNGRRDKPDYGLFKYSKDEEAYITANKLINTHIWEEHRAITYAYYLHGWFNYKLYKWNSVEGDTIDIFNYAKRTPAYNMKACIGWLDRMGLMKDFVPTGKVFTGNWELDNPLLILEEMEEDVRG